jgi:hypothetical protein
MDGLDKLQDAVLFKRRLRLTEAAGGPQTEDLLLWRMKLTEVSFTEFEEA